MSERSSRPPRINIGLPDGIVDKLERYAKSRKSKAATEATYLLTRVLDDLDDQGKIPHDDQEKVLHKGNGLSTQEALELLKGFLNSLIDTASHDGYSLAEIAEILERDSDRDVIELVNKVGNGENNRVH
jgi:DNA-directed RNA polymerase specialized sigma24 family protein